MGFDKWFGFDLIQRKTLEKQLALAGALTPEQTAAIAAVGALPTTDPEVDFAVWNDNGTIKVSNGN